MLGRARKIGARKKAIAIAAGALVILLAAVTAVAAGGGDSTDSGHATPPGASKSASAETSNAAAASSSGSNGSGAALAAAKSGPGDVQPMHWVSNRERVKRHEALPCTGPKDPINFEIFSSGQEVAGLSLNDYERRCDTSTPADEQPANFTSYLYGDCTIAPGETGCPPPLQIQSFPACQRSLADYTLEGELLPYRELPKIGGARVVEIDLMGEKRIEVYTGDTTIVIFAATSELAQEALAQLTPQAEGQSPATSADELDSNPDHSLAPPSEGAIEGELPCRS